MARSKNKTVRKFKVIRIITIGGALFFASIIAILFFATMNEQVISYGTIIPADKIEIHATEGTVITKVFVKVNDTVESGDPVVEIYRGDLPYELGKCADAIAQKQAEIDVAKASLEALKKNPLPDTLWFTDLSVQSAKADFEAKKRDFDRAVELCKEGAMTEAARDAAEREYTVSKVAYNRELAKDALAKSGLAEALIAQSASEVALAQTQLEALKNERKRIEEKIAEKTLRAPEAGTITFLEKGDGDNVDKGELIAVISTSEDVKLRAYVNERQMFKVGLGQKVQIRSSVYPYRKFGVAWGEIDKVEAWAQNKGKDYYYEVEAKVTDAPFQLMLGSSAEARIIIQRRPVIDILLNR